MKGFIFLSEVECDLFLESISQNIDGSIDYKGKPPYQEPIEKMGARKIKHPTLNKWAIIADNSLCNEHLNICVDLNLNDWINNNNL